ncbi:MAG: preprotein translocase subunit SecY [Candidatus Margulisiibacteriota bacterium]|jgi:preprotein translocase subunit SecY
MVSNLSAIFKIPDLRKRFFYTIGILILFRLGTHIPIAGIDPVAVRSLFDRETSGLLGLANLFSGGALSNFSIFALGILPYINASIIMQLMVVVVPQLKELFEEGDSGRKQIAQYTRYLTIFLALVQAIGWITGPLRGAILPDYNFIWFFISASIFLIAGSMFVMWLGELITEHGIGNGASLLIFTGIISRLFNYFFQTYAQVQSGVSVLNVVLMCIVLLGVIVSIIYVQQAERKIPVQYAKRVVGRKVYGGQSTYIPLKINQGGVLPIIFATTVLSFLFTVVNFFPGEFMKGVAASLGGGAIYAIFLFFLIFFFTFFYTAIMFNPVELADNIKKYGGFILGVRPGKPTADFLEKIITRLTLVGALFLAFVAIVPMTAASITRITAFSGIGGTSLLIMVGVALDLVRQIEMHLVNRQYEGMVDR